MTVKETAAVRRARKYAADNVSWWATEAFIATRKRNDWIREMRERGSSLREIAAAARLSHGAIAKILKRV